MEIKGFIDVSFVDWDGKLTSVIFLPYCNFRCPFCYNVDLVLHPEKLDTIPLDFVEKQLEKQKEWVDAVCITGGEPTIHKELIDLCSNLKKNGFLIKLDTNGSNYVVLKELIDKKLVDYLAMDIKAPLTKEKYSKVIGIDVKEVFDSIKKSIALILESNIDYEFRITLVPTLHGKEDITQICRDLKGCKKFVLQSFDVSLGKTTLDTNFSKKTPFGKEKMKELLNEAQKYIPIAKIR